MYPNFEEIKKYTGVVEARNFEVFRERLAKNGMLHQANDFFRATGAHTVLQYKEVNESRSVLATPVVFSCWDWPISPDRAVPL